jgi:outer membrane protein assembly factor BamA
VIRAGTYRFLLAALLCASTTLAQESQPHRVIGTITVKVIDVFGEKDAGGFYRAANNLKINTREVVIRRELVIKEGDDFSELAVRESERNLRTLPFLRTAFITTREKNGIVDVLVEVQDAWTFLPQLNFSTGSGATNRSFVITDSNIGGFGKRLELGYADEDGRSRTQGIVEDLRFFGTRNRLFGAYLDREDGEIARFEFGRPFRTLLDESSWGVTISDENTIGRLFRNGDERYIFRQKHQDLELRYTFATGKPTETLWRYTVGYDYMDGNFSQANQRDYDDLNLNPAVVSNDPSLLPENRRFSGPMVGVQMVEGDFIARNYIDRFDRVVDYNLGNEGALSVTFASEVLGSLNDAFIFSGQRSRGWRIGEDAFARGEIGLASRLGDNGLENSLYRTEVKAYQVLGPKYLGKRFIGKHTLAANFVLEYGEDLDRDRELLVGADNSLRGYEAKTFTGNKRWSLNLEDRIHLYEDLLKLVSVGLAGFVDVGGATSEPLGHLFTNDMFGDVGFGLRLAFPRSTGGRVLRLDVAFPFRDGPDGSDAYKVRVLVAGGQLFSSKLRSETFGPEKASYQIGFDR